jgi:hypothetical protein
MTKFRLESVIMFAREMVIKIFGSRQGRANPGWKGRNTKPRLETDTCIYIYINIHKDIHMRISTYLLCATCPPEVDWTFVLAHRMWEGEPCSYTCPV